MTTDPAGSVWRVPALRSTSLAVLLAFVGFATSLGTLPARVVDLDLGDGAAGIPTAATLVATVAVQLLTAPLLRRVRAGTLFAIGLVLLGAPSPLYAMASELVGITGISVVRGIGFAFVTVIGALSATAAVQPERRGAAIGVYGAAIAVPTAVCPSIGAALVEAGRFGWVCALLSVPVLALPACRRISVPADDPGRSSHGAAAVLRSYALPCLLLVAVTAGGGGVLTILPAMSAGLDATTLLLAFGLSGVLSRWGAGPAADRWGSARLIGPVAAIGAGGLGLLALAVGAGSLLLAVIGLLAFGVGYGAIQSLVLDLGLARYTGRDAATVSTVWNVAFDAGTGAGAALLGYLAATGLAPSGTFGVWAGVLLVCTVLGLPAVRAISRVPAPVPTPRSAPGEPPPTTQSSPATQPWHPAHPVPDQRDGAS